MPEYIGQMNELEALRFIANAIQNGAGSGGGSYDASNVAITGGTITGINGLGVSGDAEFGGYVQVSEQSAPAAQADAIRIFADTSNRLSWVGEGGAVNLPALLGGAGAFSTVTATGLISARNGADNTEIRAYGLDTDGSNYHYGSFAMSDTALTISTATAGTGVDNLSITLTPSGTGNVNTPAALSVSGGISSGATIDGANLQSNAAGVIYWFGRSWMTSPSDGDVEITKNNGVSTDTAIILSSPDGNRWRVTVDNAGAIAITDLDV